MLSAVNTRHRDLSSRARLLAGERELRNRPATGNKALQDRDSTFRQSRRRGGGPGRAPGLTGAPDVAAALRRLVATAPVRNGITAGVVDAEPRSAVPRLGYPPHNPWRTGEVLAVSGDRQSRSPLRAATHDYRGRASGVGPATNKVWEAPSSAGATCAGEVRCVWSEAGRCWSAFVAVRTVVIIPGDTPRANRVLEEAEILSSASGVHARLSPQASVSPVTGSRRWGCRA